MVVQTFLLEVEREIRRTVISKQCPTEWQVVLELGCYGENSIPSDLLVVKRKGVKIGD